MVKKDVIHKGSQDKREKNTDLLDQRRRRNKRAKMGYTQRNKALIITIKKKREKKKTINRVDKEGKASKKGKRKENDRYGFKQYRLVE